MSKQDIIEMDGTVTESLKGGRFKVRLEENNHEVICTPCGKIKINKIHIIEGDKVTVELSPYDLNLGRISWRYS